MKYIEEISSHMCMTITSHVTAGLGEWLSPVKILILRTNIGTLTGPPSPPPPHLPRPPYFHREWFILGLSLGFEFVADYGLPGQTIRVILCTDSLPCHIFLGRLNRWWLILLFCSLSYCIYPVIVWEHISCLLYVVKFEQVNFIICCMSEGLLD